MSVVRRRETDLVLVHPNGRAGIYQSISALAAVEPPLWACMLAAYARGKGLRVAVIDAEAENLSASEVAARVSEANPYLAAIVVYGHQPSASTQVMPAALEAVREIFYSCGASTRTLLVGGHVAALPESSLSDDDGAYASFACAGEGFTTIVELTRALEEPNVETRNERIRAVHDLVFRTEEGQEIGHGHGPPALLLGDLDHEVPAPAWDLLRDLSGKTYRAHNWHALGYPTRAPYASLYTTLGCKFDCDFCCIQSPFRSGERAAGARGNSYRRWSPARVGQTLEELAHAGVKHVKIADEMFVLNQVHVEGVCDEILRRGLDLNLWAYARTDTVRAGLLDKMKEAGFNWLAFGIESGDATVRAGSNKRLGFAEDIEGVIAEVRKRGIHVIANYIFGLPGETAQSMAATLDFAQHLNTEFANFYAAMAYPGSALYAEAATRRPEDLPASWSGYSQHSKDSKPLRTRLLSSREILAFRDEAFTRYHSSPAYLDMLEKTFGASAVNDVKEMLAVKIERNP